MDLNFDTWGSIPSLLLTESRDIRMNMNNPLTLRTCMETWWQGWYRVNDYHDISSLHEVWRHALSKKTVLCTINIISLAQKRVFVSAHFSTIQPPFLRWAICRTQVSVDMLLNMDIMLGSLLANSKLFCYSPFSAVGQGCLKPLLVMNVESYFKRFRHVKSSRAD